MTPKQVLNRPMPKPRPAELGDLEARPAPSGTRVIESIGGLPRGTVPHCRRIGTALIVDRVAAVAVSDDHLVADGPRLVEHRNTARSGSYDATDCVDCGDMNRKRWWYVARSALASQCLALLQACPRSSTLACLGLQSLRSMGSAPSALPLQHSLSFLTRGPSRPPVPARTSGKSKTSELLATNPMGMEKASSKQTGSWWAERSKTGVVLGLVGAIGSLMVLLRFDVSWIVIATTYGLGALSAAAMVFAFLRFSRDRTHTDSGQDHSAQDNTSEPCKRRGVRAPPADR